MVRSLRRSVACRSHLIVRNGRVFALLLRSESELEVDKPSQAARVCAFGGVAYDLLDSAGRRQTDLRYGFVQHPSQGTSQPRYVSPRFFRADGEKTEDADQGDAIELMLFTVIQAVHYHDINCGTH